MGSSIHVPCTYRTAYVVPAHVFRLAFDMKRSSFTAKHFCACFLLVLDFTYVSDSIDDCSRAHMSMMFWSRDTDPAATPSVPPKPPFEARGVDTIMNLRKAMPCGGDAGATHSIPTSLPDGAGAEEDTMSIQERFEGQRPKDIKAWLDFRVS